MALTVGNIVGLIIISIIGLGFGISLIYSDYTLSGIITIIITIIFCIGAVFGISWYHTNTTNGVRIMKDYQSNMSNGIERNLKIITDNGTIIYERTGKFDLEMHDNYIVFDENNTRTILYKSYTATMVVEEIRD